MIVHYIRVAGFLHMSWTHIRDGQVRAVFSFFSVSSQWMFIVCYATAVEDKWQTNETFQSFRENEILITYHKKQRAWHK